MRWLCTILAGAVTASLLFIRAQLPRTTITLEPGPFREYMFREAREITFLADSRRLVTKDWRQPTEDGAAIEDYLLRLWDARTGRLVATLLEGPAADVVAWSSDPPRVAAATWEGEVGVWDSEDGTLLWKKPAEHALNHFFVDGLLHAVAYDSPIVRNLETGACVHLIKLELWQDCRHAGNRFRRPNGVHLTRSNRWVADLAQNKIVLVLPPISPEVGSPNCNITPDGRFVWSWHDSGFEVWNVATQASSRHAAWHPYITSFTSDGGSYTLNSDVDFPPTWRDWLAKMGAPINVPHAITCVRDGPKDREIYCQRGGVFGVFSPDGKTLAVLRDDNVIDLWDWPMGVPWPRVFLASATSIAIVFVYTALRDRLLGVPIR
jgi:WD40 repeat protein